MRRKPSQATVRAMERVAGGEPPYRAALAEGVSPSTVYRALARARRPSAPIREAAARLDAEGYEPHPGIYWDDERRADEHHLDRPDDEDEQ